MTMRLRSLWLASTAAFALTASPLWAQSSGGLTITLTPEIEFGVVVETASFAVTLASGVPFFTEAPILVRIVGDAEPIELDLSADDKRP